MQEQPLKDELMYINNVCVHKRKEIILRRWWNKKSMQKTYKEEVTMVGVSYEDRKKKMKVCIKIEKKRRWKVILRRGGFSEE